jgi:DNA-directed RNA polymerase subunit M/transcription elongation factor TFIIS
MSNPSPTFCPACHRLMAPRTLQTEDWERVLTTECRDCGVMFNSQTADIEKERPQSVSFEERAIPWTQSVGRGRQRPN